MSINDRCPSTRAGQWALVGILPSLNFLISLAGVETGKGIDRMLDIIHQILRNLVAIWTSGSAAQFWSLYVAYAIGTFFLFMPVYALTFGIGFLGIKHKILTKIGTGALALNAVVALMPCALPIAIPMAMAWGLWQVLKPAKPQRNQRRQRRPARRDDDDSDSDEDPE